jgi:hypothetical protein
MSAAGGGKSSGSGYQTAATTLGNQAANTIGSQTGITPGGAGMFSGILNNFGNNLGDAFASQPGQIPWNPRANRQPITTPEDQRELYDNAPPGVSIGGGPAPRGPNMPNLGMPSPGMPGGKGGGGFNPFKIDRTPPPNMSPEQQQAFNWQNRMTMDYDPRRDQEAQQIMKGYYDQNPRPTNQFTPQFGAGSQMTGGPAGQPITNQPATKRYIANTANVPGSDYTSGWNNMQQQYGITDVSGGKTPFSRTRQYELTDDQYNQMKSNPYLSMLEETPDYRDAGTG